MAITPSRRRSVRHSNRQRNRVSRPQAQTRRVTKASSDGKPLRSPDVVYVPTPYEAVEAMLKVAKVGKDDVVYDLGVGRRTHPDHGGAEV